VSGWKELNNKSAPAKAGAFGKGVRGIFKSIGPLNTLMAWKGDELTLHHLKPGIKLMVTRHATDAI
jgi:hypothetical protein